jgi:putative ABC transport system permease protein
VTGRAGRLGLLALAVRNLTTRRLRTGLTVLGVVLGVAAVVAVTVNGATTTRSLETLFANVSGRADLTVEPADRSRGLRERDLDRVRRTPGVATAVGNTYLSVPIRAKKPTSLTLVGVDPALDQAVRVYRLVGGRFLAPRERGDAVVLATVAARRLGVGVGDTLTLDLGQDGRDLTVVGLVADQGAGHIDSGAVGFVDLRLARELAGTPGRLDQVDVLLAPSARGTSATVEAARVALAAALGPSYTVSRPGASGASIAELLTALHTGLGIFGAVALFVGALLIYNTFAMTVAERTAELGLLRALGATRRQVLALVLGEAAVLGLVGTAAGVALGIVLAVPLVRVTGELVGVTLDTFTLPPGGLAAGVLVGLATTLGASALPAWRASRVAPMAAMRPAAQPDDERLVRWAARASLGALALAGLAWLVPSVPRPAFFVLAFLAVTLLVPALLTRLEAPARRLVATVYGGEGDLGARNLARARGRTSLTVSVLVVGLVLTVSIGALGTTFGSALRTWVARAVGGDLVIESDQALPRRIDAAVAAVPGVAAVTPTRLTRLKLVRVQPAGGPAHTVDEDITFQAVDPATYPRVAGFQFSTTDRPEATMLADLARGGAVFVASVLAEQYGLKPGDTVVLRTASGEVPFRVAGVIVHFERVGRTLVGSWTDLTRVLRRSQPGALLVKLAPGADPATVEAAIQRGPGRGTPLTITRGDSFRQTITADLDRILLLFRAVLAIALTVAGLGVVNTMAMNVLERLREIGTLRAVGMTRRQVARMILAEAGAMAVVGAAVGLVAGVPLSWALVRQMTAASGFRFAYVFPALAFAAGLLIVLVLSQLAAAWPAARAARVDILKAIQYE